MSKESKNSNLTFPVDDKKPSKKDELIESLQKRLDSEKDKRLEERWIWFVSLMLMFDSFAFQDMETWSGPLSIGVIEFFVVVALGGLWGVNPIWTLIITIIQKWDGKIGGNSKD